MPVSQSASPKIFRTSAELRRQIAEWRRDSGTVGLVPTMGGLHAGHLALVDAVQALASHSVVSIFVNPTQFAANEDLDTYPKNEQADVDMLAAHNVGAVFAPSADEIYPADFATTISVAGPGTGLETDFRPHFFSGVATVVAKLLLACSPDFSIFGEKDYQQLVVIRRMVADLGIDTKIVGHPTIRETDGLAMSSRNTYLSPSDRQIAPMLNRILVQTADNISSGTNIPEVLGHAKLTLGAAGFNVDYFELRNAETLAPIDDVEKEPLRLLAAAWLGKTRLIDNIPL